MKRLSVATGLVATLVAGGTFSVACALLLGCKPAAVGPTVEGAVTLDGKPLANANVQFIPQGENRGQTGFGKTDSAGKFTIGPVGGKQRGAMPGEYKVVINKHVRPDGSDYVPKPDEDPMLGNFKELLPAAYSDAEKTVLTANVPAGGTSSLEFKLNSKQK
jgi:hypothetical protein